MTGLDRRRIVDGGGAQAQSFIRMKILVGIVRPWGVGSRGTTLEWRCNETTPTVAVDLRSLVRRGGLEPPTRCLEGSRSVQTELPARHERVPEGPYRAASSDATLDPVRARREIAERSADMLRV